MQTIENLSNSEWIRTRRAKPTDLATLPETLNRSNTVWDRDNYSMAIVTALLFLAATSPFFGVRNLPQRSAPEIKLNNNSSTPVDMTKILVIPTYNPADIVRKTQSRPND